MASKKQQAYKAEYKKARRNLQQNVRRLEKRGYDVSAIKIPEIPKGNIKKSDINLLNKLNTQRYDLSTKFELVSKRLPSGERVEVLESVSGKRARRFERKRSASKASAERQKTRRLSKEAKQDYKSLKQLYNPQDDYHSTIDPDSFISEYEYRENLGEKYGSDWVLDDEGMDYYNRVGNKWYHGDTEEYDRARTSYDPKGAPFYDEETGEVFDPRTGSYIEETDIDFQKNVYWEDTETGEILERPYGARKPKNGREYIRVMPQTENGKAAYDSAMAQLEIMSNYSGDPRHGKNTKHDGVTRYNATSIKNTLQSLHDADPGAVESAILNSDYVSDFHSVDYMYRTGGYERYLSRFVSMLSSLGENVDQEMDEDYDEGNYDY